MEFIVTGVGLLSEADKARNHQIVLTFETATTNASRQNVWAWGNTEAPSSITFNAEEPAAVVTENGVGHGESASRVSNPRLSVGPGRGGSG